MGRPAFLAAALGLLAGCAANHAHVEQAVLAGRPSPAHLAAVAAGYRARCPDVLRVEVAELPHYDGARRIDPDGRIDLGDAGRPRVDGGTPPEIVRVVAQTLSVPPERVRVEVAEYKSQFVYVFGEVAGLQRAVPYRGPETVLDLLHRMGGLTAGAALRDVQVVRPHVADGKRPEIFHVDLHAIVLRHDAETNITLEPYDQVYIAQSPRASFGDCLPPWLRPVYQRMCGLKRRPQQAPPNQPGALATGAGPVAGAPGW